MGHLPLTPVTLNYHWRISILAWTHRPTMNQEAGGGAKPKEKQQSQAKQNHEG